MVSSGLAPGSPAVTGGTSPSGRPAGRRRRRLLLALAAALLLAAGAITYAVWPRGWRMVWHDEFSGTSVNTARWSVRHDTYLPYEHSILTADPANVRVADGMLTLRAQREQRTVGRTTREYTSGYLDTVRKHSWRYARFEMRAKLPTAEGMWPAFWLRADKGLGEIDIMEAIGGLPRMAQQAVIRSTTDGREKEVNRYDLPSGTIAGWHVYAAEVSPEAVTFSIDGKRVFQVKSVDVPWLRDTFDEPMNIRLNLQVGGTLPDYYHHPLDSSTRLPATYLIDWVRVYQHA